MDFVEVCEFFGGSIFPDDYRGDYEETKGKVSALRQLVADETSEASAKVLLLEGIQCMVTGFHKSAFDIFEKLRTHAVTYSWTAEWDFRSWSYTLLNAVFAEYCPILRGAWLKPGRSELFLQEQLPAQKLINMCIDACWYRWSDASEVAQLEHDTFVLIFAGHNNAYEVRLARKVQSLTGEVDSTRDQHAHTYCIEIGDRSIDALDQQDKLTQSGLVTVARHIKGLQMEICRARAETSFKHRCLEMHDQLLKSGDPVALVQAKILIADNILCGPDSSPLFLGLVLEDHDFKGPMAQSFWNPDEPLIPPRAAYLATTHVDRGDKHIFDALNKTYKTEPMLTGPAENKSELLARSNAAATLYADAQRIMRREQLYRGVAVLQLRLFCLIWMLSDLPAHEWSIEDAYDDEFTNFFRVASESVERSGDNHLQRIVFQYRFLASGSASKEVDHARDAGSWASEEWSFRLIYGLGLFAQQYGHYRRFICSSLYPACRAYELARLTFFRLPGLDNCWFPAVCSLIDTLIALGRFQTARIYLEDIRGGLNGIIRHYEEVPGRTEDIVKTKRQYVWEVLHRFVTVYNQSGVFSNKEGQQCRSLIVLLRTFSKTETDLHEIPGWQCLVDFMEIKRSWKDLYEDGEAQVTRPFIERALLPVAAQVEFDRLENCNFALTTLAHDIISILVEMDQLALAEVLSEKWISSLLKTIEELGFLNPGSAQGETSMDLNCRTKSIDTKICAIMTAETGVKICSTIKAFRNALKFLMVLDVLSPGYSNGVRSPTNTLAWQRRLWLGCIVEDMGAYSLALSRYGNAFLFAQHLLTERTVDISSSAFNLPDFGRVISCLARMCLFVAAEVFELNHAPVDILNDPELHGLGFHDRIWAHQLPADSAHKRALELLDFERARILYQMQAVDHLAESHKEQADFLEAHRTRAIYTELRSFPHSRSYVEELEHSSIHAAARMKGERTFFRTYETHSFFSEAESNLPKFLGWSDFVGLLDSRTVLLYMSTSAEGLGLFCMNEKDLLHASWNTKFSMAEISIRVSQYLGLLKRYKSRVSERILRDISLYISSFVIEPVAHILQHYDKIVFCPSGPLLRFPLTALILNEEYLALSKVTWQIPSLSFLYYHTRNPRKKVSSRTKMTAMASISTIRDTLMKRSEPRLPMAGVEAVMVAATLDGREANFKNTCLMTRDDFRTALETFDFIHVATHGYSDSKRPLNSYISLKERLRVLDISGVRSKAIAVVFSSCVSGDGVALSNDDVMGFPHAILATGAMVFAGCLCATNDLVALLHSYWFYHLLGQSSGAPSSFAAIWHAATLLTAGSSTNSLEYILRSMVEHWDRMVSWGLDLEDFAPGGRQRLLDAKAELINQAGEEYFNFQHPFFWTPFVLVGDGGLVLGVKRDDVVEEQIQAIKETARKMRDKAGLTPNVLDLVLFGETERVAPERVLSEDQTTKCQVKVVARDGREYFALRETEETT